MTFTGDGASTVRKPRLVWRILLWFVLSLLLSSGIAASIAWYRNDIPQAIDPLFYGSAVTASLCAAWAFGLLGKPINSVGKVAIILAGFAVPIIFFVIAVVVVVADMNAHLEQPPPIARNQDFGMEGMPMERPLWTAKLRKSFPAGSNESDMTRVLHKQGFAIDTKRHVATVSYQGDAICRTYLSIGWTLRSDGQIANVDGESMGACP